MFYLFQQTVQNVNAHPVATFLRDMPENASNCRRQI